MWDTEWAAWMSNPQQQRLIGKVIADRYRIIEQIGEGGMGAVYLAEHLTLHKQVALKVVHAEHAKNPELATRFSREAMATSRIEHPNVISAIDFGTLPDGTAYLAVQLVRGPTLTRVLTAEGPLPWARAVSIGSQIADALSAAHGHGIVHRDLKPDNVLLQYLDDGGELVKVLDFGVAKFSGEANLPKSVNPSVTQVGFIVGTPGYMAPEQAVGTNADERSDLYSLGVILWECIVGRPLWVAPDLQRLVERQLVEEPSRLRSSSPDTTIPALLEDLVARLLSRRASDRPDDASSVRDALREFLTLAAEEHQRWRTGARPVPSSLRGDSVRPPLPLRHSKGPPSSPANPRSGVPIKTAGSESGTARPTGISSRPPRLLVRHSKTAWVFSGLLAAILLAAVILVATGAIELRPKGGVAAVAQHVEQELNLPAGALSGPTKSGLPRSLEPTYDRLLLADTREERIEAANAVLSHTPPTEVPTYMRRMANLQLAKSCEEKRQAIEKLAEVNDVRTLPLLVRLAQKPRTGCGRKHREDCLECLRAPLEELISQLERGTTGQSTR
jgi:serine/threonine-protein kinase